tara:strand:+ start:1570 stop:1890 length:321 start_codon:yes stop_codon:yes gene_type:complete
MTNPVYTSKLETKVKAILETIPTTRENDHALVAHYWAEELSNGPIRVESAQGLLTTLASGGLTKYSSISRARRKIQEKHVHLRGTSYNIRQNKSKKTKKYFGGKVI